MVLKSALPAKADNPGTAVFNAATRRVALGYGLAAVLGSLFATSQGEISLLLFLKQDLIVLPLCGCILLAGALAPPRYAASWFAQVVLGGAKWSWAAALLVTGLTFVGALTVTHNYPLSMDEFMARFDAQILATGRLLAPVDPSWREYVAGLQPIFVRPGPGMAAWSSNYLPLNAAVQALFSWLATPTLANPVLAGACIFAVHRVARLIWPERRDAAVVASLLLASSAQFLVTAMTPYAMTGHLTLNLVWLWLFLKGTRVADCGALVVGFLAAGLHQVAFHPIFVAPFVVYLWIRKDYVRGTVYTLIYAVICLFWITYRKIAVYSAGLVLEPGAAQPGLIEFYLVILDLIQPDIASIAVMARNLIRLAAWQNPFVLVLVAVAAFHIRTWPPLMIQLLAGIGLTLVIVSVVMPAQGHGWGYRYAHGLLGSFALLATQGWCQITLNAGERERLTATLFHLSAMSLCILLPLRALQVEAAVRPFAAASRAISEVDADIVIVDSSDIPYGWDLVRNRPDLSNRPKVFLASRLTKEQAAALCTSFKVAEFGRDQAVQHGMLIIPGAGGGKDHLDPSGRVCAGTGHAPG